ELLGLVVGVCAELGAHYTSVTTCVPVPPLARRSAYSIINPLTKRGTGQKRSYTRTPCHSTAGVRSWHSFPVRIALRPASGYGVNSTVPNVLQRRSISRLPRSQQRMKPLYDGR